MLTQVVASVLYAVIAASVLFQILTAARCAAHAARKRVGKCPAAPAVPPHARRLRQREYRLTLRVAKASLLAKS